MTDDTDTQNENGENDSTEAEIEPEPEGGPLERERAFLEERFASLHPREEAEERDAKAEASRIFEVEPRESEDEAEEEIPEGPLPSEFRKDLIEQYRKRQRRQLERTDEDENEEPTTDGGTASAADAPPEPPQPPPGNNWISIGPSVVRKGQGEVKPAVSGRTPGIAVAPGGNRVYIGAANGGVWRSENAGETWTSLMEAFDLNPTHRAADSLACGAIALVPGATASQDRLYVGTGEGPGGTYMGVGPLVSTDGGTSWNPPEPTSPGSPELAGCAFYALAVDPSDEDRVVGATRPPSGGAQGGIYRREPDGTGGFHWDRKTLPGASSSWATSVVATHAAGTTTFYAATWLGPVYSSTDGDTWTQITNGFPTSNVGRIGLAVQQSNPDVVYALVHNQNNGAVLGIWRYDASDNTWRQVTGHPPNLFGNPNPSIQPGTQGWYDLAIAVDPNNVNRLYLGGSTVWTGGDWSGSLYRSVVSSGGSGSSLSYSMSNTYIGDSVHADIHTLVFTPSDSNKLWVGCDGGVFYSTNPSGGSSEVFEARNTGLATLTMNYLGQHLTEDAVLFAGTQDNGGERFSGEEVWLYSAGGDCGYFVVNWADPYKVLNTYVYGFVRRSTDGGTRYSYTNVPVPLASGEQVLFYAPLVGTPPNPGNPSEADMVAFGSKRPWISTDFGDSWESIPNDDLGADQLDERIKSLIFASATKLYAGTMAGGVYRFDKSGTSWSRTQLDTMGGSNSLPLAGPVTDIAVDAADASGDSIYITFGGAGDFRHVWHFDGASWEQRSGPSAGHIDSLLDVHHSAIVVDSDNLSHIYVGADIGVWRSLDSGATWDVFSEGLPDAAVMDLKLHNDASSHPEVRILRASTHGRSVFERTLDMTPKQGIELYVRDTQLDQGRFETVNFLPDPTTQGTTVRHWAGPDIKLDTPDGAGMYQFPTMGTIDFHEFVDELTDDFRNVATHATETLTTRVYVQVHNRGVEPADDVRVMLLLANASAGLPPLPTGYDVHVRNGNPINTADWRTLGVVTLDDIHDGFPKIAAFNLSSNKLPVPANLADNDHHCVLALIHHPDDPYTSTETNTDQNSKRERKATHKNLKVVPFVGTLPRQSPFIVPLRLNNPHLEEEHLTTLRLLLNGYPGRVRLYIPEMELEDELEELVDGLRLTDDLDRFEEWAEEYRERLNHNRDIYDEEWSEDRLEGIERVLDFGVALDIEEPGQEEAELRGIVLAPNEHYTVFLAFDSPDDEKVGQAFNVRIEQQDYHSDETIGGIDVRIDLVPEPDLDKRIDLKVWIDEWRWGYSIVRATLTGSDGRLFTPDHNAIVELSILDDERPLQKRTMQWHGGWNSFASFLRLPKEADAVQASSFIGTQRIAMERIRIEQRGTGG